MIAGRVGAGKRARQIERQNIGPRRVGMRGGIGVPVERGDKAEGAISHRRGHRGRRG